MLIPKRHFQHLWDTTEEEMAEYNQLVKKILEIYSKKNLHRKDGSKIKNYVFFWRLRNDSRDPISHNTRPDHFHLHIAPDKEHRWDPVVDPTASQWNIRKFLET